MVCVYAFVRYVDLRSREMQHKMSAENGCSAGERQRAANREQKADPEKLASGL